MYTNGLELNNIYIERFLCDLWAEQAIIDNGNSEMKNPIKADHLLSPDCSIWHLSWILLYCLLKTDTAQTWFYSYFHSCMIISIFSPFKPKNFMLYSPGFCPGSLTFHYLSFIFFLCVIIFHLATGFHSARLSSSLLDCLSKIKIQFSHNFFKPISFLPNVTEHILSSWL